MLGCMDLRMTKSCRSPFGVVELFFRSLRLWAHAILLIGLLWTTVLSFHDSAAAEQCVQVYRKAKDARPSTFQVDDVEPLSFEELDGYRVYSVHLKNGKRKVIRFAKPITIQFEAFAAGFFQRYSTTATSKVRVFSKQETLTLLEMLRQSDPELVEFMLHKAPRDIPLASAVDFQDGIRGMDYLAGRGLDWRKIVKEPNSTQLSDELVFQSNPPLLPMVIRVQLADYWATATVLQILDPHSKNWLYDEGQVVAIDLAYPSTARDLQKKANPPLNFKYSTGPFSFAEVSTQMRAHLIEHISPRLLDHLRQVDADSIAELAAQSGLKLRDEYIQGVLGRIHEILKLRGQ